MKRKTTILLSSILAGSLLVGGAFAAYAVTDKANPRVITVTPGTPIIPDEQVKLSWGEGSSHETLISSLSANVLVRAAHVSLEADAEYTGLFTVDMKSYTATHDGENLIDNLEVYVYKGDVALDNEGKIPSTAFQASEVIGIVKATEKDTEGVKHWSLAVAIDPEKANPDYSVFVRIVVDEDKFGQLSTDQVTVTLDWGKGSQDDYYVEELTPSTAAGYYFVGSFNNWGTYTQHKFAPTQKEGEYKVEGIELKADDEFKAEQLVNEGDPVWYPATGGNLKVPAAKYDVLFSPVYREDWETGVTHETMFGRGGYFWFIPYEVEPVVYPQTTGKYALISDDLALVANLAHNTESEYENEYYVQNLTLNQGDKFVLYDSENKATWTVAIDGASYGGDYNDYIVIENGYYVVQQDHHADVYVKFIYQSDNVYFGLNGTK